MSITYVIKPEAVVPLLKSTTKEAVIKELARVIKKTYPINISVDEITKQIIKREKLGSTGIGSGVAIPHAKFKDIETALGAYGKTSKGIKFNAIDGQPVTMFFLVLCPENNPENHAAALQSIARLISQQNFVKFLKNTKTAKEIYDLFIEFEKKIEIAQK